jgi:hypothetical protein
MRSSAVQLADAVEWKPTVETARVSTRPNVVKVFISSSFEEVTFTPLLAGAFIEQPMCQTMAYNAANGRTI